jgi:D-glycero-beta-D-manno-heptose 1-phosphate adenylyltransferase
MRSGIYTLIDLQQEIKRHPDQWRPLVLTNGCFDLLHAGHVRYLQAAQQLGRALVVGVNSDHSVRQLKPQDAGRPARPIVPAAQRAEVVAALKAVDAVVIFEELTAGHLITTLYPDIYAKGGDYQLETLPEVPIVQAYGGKIELIQITLPSSTSNLIERILSP